MENLLYLLNVIYNKLSLLDLGNDKISFLFSCYTGGEANNFIFPCSHPKRFSGLLLHLQVSLEEKVSLRISMKILSHSFKLHMATDGILGLLTRQKNIFPKIQHLDLSGGSILAGNIKVKHGREVAMLSLMMNHILQDRVLIEQFWVCPQQVP